MSTSGDGPDRDAISQPVRVLIVDDHSILRESLSILLDNRPAISLVGDCADGREAVEEVVKVLPDVVLMDLNMPRLNGVEATRQIHQRAPGVRVLVLSSFGSHANVRDAIRAGASGFVIKRSDTDELITAIQTVRQGRMYFSEALVQTLDIERLITEATQPHVPSGRELLTPRELEIVQLVAEGHSAKEIGGELHISEKTVEAHKANIMSKTGAKNRLELLRFALESGIVGSSRPEDEMT